jgi:hypothetical protein
VPLPSLLAAADPAAARALLYLALCFKALGQCSAFTGAIIMVNAAPALGQLGAVNGVGQTLASLVRGIGPAVGGVLWGAFLQVPRPGSPFLTYLAVAATALAADLVYRRVSEPAQAAAMTARCSWPPAGQALTWPWWSQRPQRLA